MATLKQLAAMCVTGQHGALYQALRKQHAITWGAAVDGVRMASVQTAGVTWLLFATGNQITDSDMDYA
jgi:hypothetical protein